MPMEVCMIFGNGAKFFIERGVARQLTKDQAKEVLRTAAEAGLVHAGPDAGPASIRKCASPAKHA